MAMRDRTLDRVNNKGGVMAKSQNATIDAKLLEILVCPITKTALTYDADAQELISKKAKLAFPIRDGIPIMLSDEARKL